MIELDFRDDRAWAYIPWDSFFKMCLKDLEGVSIPSALGTTEEYPDIPDGPLQLPPHPLSIECLAINFKFMLQQSSMAAIREDLEEDEDAYNDWLREDEEHGFGDDEYDDDRDFELGAFLEDEEDYDSDDDYDEDEW